MKLTMNIILAFIAVCVGMVAAGTCGGAGADVFGWTCEKPCNNGERGPRKCGHGYTLDDGDCCRNDAYFGEPCIPKNYDSFNGVMEPLTGTACTKEEECCGFGLCHQEPQVDDSTPRTRKVCVEPAYEDPEVDVPLKGDPGYCEVFPCS